jgi:hypothetical protein
MSSNAVSNQPTNEFFARAKELLQEKFNIGKDVESSSTKSKKLTNEGKETYQASIEESIGEVNIGSIQEKDADSGLLRSKVFTLDNTEMEKIDTYMAENIIKTNSNITYTIKELYSNISKLLNSSDLTSNNVFPDSTNITTFKQLNLLLNPEPVLNGGEGSINQTATTLTTYPRLDNYKKQLIDCQTELMKYIPYVTKLDNLFD